MPDRRCMREETASEDAGRWFARLHADDATTADRRAFSAWLEADPSHLRAWTEMQEIAASAGLLGQRPPPVAVTRGGGRAGDGLRLRLPAAAVWALAVLLLSATAGLTWGDGWQAVALADHASRSGERCQIELPDGSVMTLNTESAVRLSWGTGERRIDLLRGEAIFKVAADAARPFVVVSRHGSAEALATCRGMSSTTDGDDSCRVHRHQYPDLCHQHGAGRARQTGSGPRTPFC